jgi:predicted dehydrogenase
MPQHYRVAGISFEHMHMGDNLAMAYAHPQCKVVGICDSERGRMSAAQQMCQLTDEQVFTDWLSCIEAVRPDFLSSNGRSCVMDRSTGSIRNSNHVGKAICGLFG